MTQMIKNLLTMQKTWVQSLGWKDPLVKEWILQYSCLENSMDCSPPGSSTCRLQSMYRSAIVYGLQRVRHD